MPSVTIRVVGLVVALSVLVMAVAGAPPVVLASSVLAVSRSTVTSAGTPLSLLDSCSCTPPLLPTP